MECTCVPYPKSCVPGLTCRVAPATSHIPHPTSHAPRPTSTRSHLQWFSGTQIPYPAIRFFGGTAIFDSLAAVLGVLVPDAQWMTAKVSVEKTTKAKRELLNAVFDNMGELDREQAQQTLLVCFHSAHEDAT